MKDKESLTKDNKSLEITANAGDLSELDKLLEVMQLQIVVPAEGTLAVQVVGHLLPVQRSHRF